MTDNLPIHLKISNTLISDDEVTSRRNSLADLKAAWVVLTPEQAIVKAATIAASLTGDGTPPKTLGDEVELAVQKHAPAFLAADRPFDVGICAGVAFVDLARAEQEDGGNVTVDLMASALWSALTFQPVMPNPKRENLRLEVLEAAQKRAEESAAYARERWIVADLGKITITVAEGKASTNANAAISGILEALRSNAELDREELNFLWWSQLGRSRLLNRPLLSIAEPLRLVAAGIEATAYLQQPPIEVHRDIVLRTVDEDPELTLGQLMQSVGDDRNKLAENQADALVTGYAAIIFPLLNALVTGATGMPGAEIRRKASEWGGRALLEASLLQETKRSVAKK